MSGLLVLAAAMATFGGERPLHAEPAPPSITLEQPPKLVEGDRARIVARVQLDGAGERRPLLLTPSSEGTAIDVVRGRMLAADADATDGSELRFAIPIVARTSGTAVLRARVLTYRCTHRCRAVEAESSTVVRVGRRP